MEQGAEAALYTAPKEIDVGGARPLGRGWQGLASGARSSTALAADATGGTRCGAGGAVVPGEKCVATHRAHASDGWHSAILVLGGTGARRTASPPDDQPPARPRGRCRLWLTANSGELPTSRPYVYR